MLGGMAGKTHRTAKARNWGAGRRPRRDASQWRQLIAQQRESGLSVRAFCEAHDLSEPGFYAWRRRLRGESIAEAGAAAFVRLEPTEPTPAWGDMIEVQFGPDVTLRCGADRLDQVVRLLREGEGDASC